MNKLYRIYTKSNLGDNCFTIPWNKTMTNEKAELIVEKSVKAIFNMTNNLLQRDIENLKSVRFVKVEEIDWTCS